jgi:hypothetical protein
LSWNNIYEKFDVMMSMYSKNKLDDKEFVCFLVGLSRMCETFLNSGRVNYYEIILGPVLAGLESDDDAFKNRADTIVRRVGTYLERAELLYPFALDFLENVYNHGGEIYMSDYFTFISKKLNAKFTKNLVKEYRFLSGSDEYYRKNKINYKDEYVWRE